MTNYFSSIYHFCQISKFKGGVTQNFLGICTLYVLHNYKNSQNSVERFQRSCDDKLFQLYISSKFKRGITPRTNTESKFLSSMHLHIIFFITKKFNENLLSGFRGVAPTKQNKTNRTNEQVLKIILPSTTRSVGYRLSNYINRNLCYFNFRVQYS